MKVIVVGPDSKRAKGGISSVIQAMKENRWLVEQAGMEFYPSYREGSRLFKVLYGMKQIANFSRVVDQYDLVHIHMSIKGSAERKMKYARIAKCHGKKVVIHIHGSSFLHYYQGLKPNKQKKLQRCLQTADCVLALSPQWKADLERTVGLNNCVMLLNGVSLKRFPAKNKPFASRNLDMLFLGRLGVRKGTDDLLLAMERMQKDGVRFRCVMAGDGPVAEYKEKVRAMGLEEQVTFAGWINGAEKLVLLEDARLLLLPSYHEGLPMSILEAMAAGEAIISTPIGGIPEAVHDGENGILVQPGDAEGLYQAISTLLNDPGKAEAMGRRSREIMDEKYDLKKLHEQLYAEYCRVLEG